MDRLVVEGGKQGKQVGNEGGIVRQKEQGYVHIYITLLRQKADIVLGGIELRFSRWMALRLNSGHDLVTTILT